MTEPLCGGGWVCPDCGGVGRVSCICNDDPMPTEDQVMDWNIHNDHADDYRDED